MYTGTAVLRFAYNAMIGACSYVNVGQFVKEEFVLERTNQNTKRAGRGSSESISRAAMVGGEYFGSDSIKHAIHDLRISRQYAKGIGCEWFTDVTEKRVTAIPSEQCRGTTSCRTREQKRPREPWVRKGNVEWVASI
jgi:hypothetical protein